MRDRGDHYLSNNAWASSGDGVAADNWELAGGRPRPSASAAANPLPPAPLPPRSHLPGSVNANKPLALVPKRPAAETTITSSAAITSSPTNGARTHKHPVFTALQQPKLLMGGELELSRINITITMLLALIAFMTLNWHLAVVAVLFGGPVQCAIRILSEDDPDYVKTYLEALSYPHIREPE